jgi:hypothetical protein
VGRRLAAFAVLGTIALGSWFAACGIDENGMLDTSDGSIQPDVIVDQIVKEANPEANPPTLSCQEAGTPLDASCLGKPVPDGWQPIAIQVGVSVGCSAGFVSTPLITNPQLEAGTCACSGCVPSGTWTCNAQIKAGQPINQSNCSAETYDASASVCWGNVSHSSYGVFLAKSGTVTCPAATQGGTLDAGSTPVTTCTPQSCDTDFCSMGAKGYKLCIYDSLQSDGGCPTDFPVGHLVGPSATVTCDSCQQCGLANSTAPCTGTATAYSGQNCTGNADQTSAAGTCGDLGTTLYASIFYDAGPVPVPSCGATTGNATGKAALDQPSTICCGQ